MSDTVPDLELSHTGMMRRELFRGWGEECSGGGRASVVFTGVRGRGREDASVRGLPVIQVDLSFPFKRHSRCGGGIGYSAPQKV